MRLLGAAVRLKNKARSVVNVFLEKNASKNKKEPDFFTIWLFLSRLHLLEDPVLMAIPSLLCFYLRLQR